MTIERRNVFAHTEQHADYPAYLSVNHEGQAFTVAVRTRGHSGMQVATIELSRSDLAALARSIQEYIAPYTDR